eukprot:maker-scaffold142_size315517-snap-gene-0.16 protein:Tk07695 transcript:maker-scaffold142_size315517-snap-gene-0.16-mRNA-1 annotation:"orotidine 5 -phosphate decarboxylase"
MLARRWIPWAQAGQGVGRVYSQAPPAHIQAVFQVLPRRQRPAPSLVTALARSMDELGLSAPVLMDQLGFHCPPASPVVRWTPQASESGLKELEARVRSLKDSWHYGDQVSYTFLLLAYGATLDRIHREPHLHHLKPRLLELSQSLRRDTIGGQSFLYFYWKALIRSRHEKCLTEAEALLREEKGLAHDLLRDCLTYAHWRIKPLTFSGDLSPGFHCEPLGALCQTLTSRMATDELSHYQCLILMSLFNWSEGKYSESLALFATVSEALAKNFALKTWRVGLGVPILVALSRIMADVKQYKMEPAQTFLDTAAAQILQTTGNSILWRFHWVFSDNPKAIKAKDRSIRAPILRPIKKVVDTPNFLFYESHYEQLELSMSLSSNDEFKQIKLGSLSSNLGKTSVAGDALDLNQLFLNRSTKTLKEPKETVLDVREKPEDIPLTPAVLREMSEIRILEALSKGLIQTGVNLTVEQLHEHQEISFEVLEKMLHLLHPERDFDLMKQLKEAAPMKSSVAELIYVRDVKDQTKWNLKRWKEGERKQAILANLRLYQMLLEEEYHLDFQALDKLLQQIRNYTRYFLEDTIHKHLSEELLDSIKQEGLSIGATFHDYSIAVLFWEGMFFSASFHQQKISEDFFMEHSSAIRKQFDIDHILGRGVRYQSEDIFRRILELTLKHDLGVYEKSKAFEALLVHQSEYGNLFGAKSTLGSANDLRIPIGADAMTIYLLNLAEKEQSRNAGVLSVFKDFFKGGTSPAATVMRPPMEPTAGRPQRAVLRSANFFHSEGLAKERNLTSFSRVPPESPPTTTTPSSPW